MLKKCKSWFKQWNEARLINKERKLRRRLYRDNRDVIMKHMLRKQIKQIHESGLGEVEDRLTENTTKLLTLMSELNGELDSVEEKQKESNLTNKEKDKLRLEMARLKKREREINQRRNLVQQHSEMDIKQREEEMLQDLGYTEDLKGKEVMDQTRRLLGMYQRLHQKRIGDVETNIERLNERFRELEKKMRAKNSEKSKAPSDEL